MKLTIAIPVMNQISETKACWGSLIANTTEKQNVQLLVINNNSTDSTVEFLEKFVFPFFPDHKLITNPENVGVLASLNQCYKESDGDVVAMIHNDLHILEFGWNDKVMYEFQQDQNLGVISFFGAKGVATNGGRYSCYSNMLEAEYHGLRETRKTEMAICDGIAIICSRKMLDASNGFDTNYTYHHFYDKDICLESIKHGFHNIMLGIFCHHLNGQTANSPTYQQWISDRLGVEQGDNESHHMSETYFLEKWKNILPLQVS